MAPSMTHGRNPRGAGPVQRSTQGATAVTPTAAVWPLAQTLPSTAPPARFRPPQVSPVARPYTAPGQSGLGPWRGGDNTNDTLIYRDRHPWLNRGTEVAGRISSMPDPPKDGPIRPSLRILNRTWNWQVGTGAAYTDDSSRDYPVVRAGAGRWWAGEQGSGWTTVYGGAPGFYRQGPGGTPVGDPNDGPVRVWGGPPHGLHTMYPPQGQQTQATAMSRPQMVPARVDRLSNSRIAGQTYSQWTQHQGGGQQ